MKKRSSGFTLIEMIVVMTIILILAGLITGAAQKAKQQAMVTRTKAMISGLETALAMFQTDLGAYPDSGNANLVLTLTSLSGTYTIGSPPASFTVTTAAGWSGPYMNFKQGETSGGSVVDAWGTPMIYSNPGADHTAASGPNNTTYLDLWSYGPNKVTNAQAGDDITNWSR